MIFCLVWYGIKAPFWSSSKPWKILCNHLHQPDPLWSPLIIADQLRSGVALLRSSQIINGSFPSWSTEYFWFYEDFSRIYYSSEVGVLPFFVKVPSYSLVFILVVQTSGSGFVLTETKTSSCRKLVFYHPHPLICVQITVGPTGGFFSTDDRDDFPVIGYSCCCIHFFCWVIIPTWFLLLIALLWGIFTAGCWLFIILWIFASLLWPSSVVFTSSHKSVWVCL